MVFIYFIQAGDRGPVKIGRTKRNVRFRLGAMQVGHYETLRVAAVIRAPRDAESFLHEKFADYHLTGEWYEVRGALEKYMASLKGRRDGVRKTKSRECPLCQRKNTRWRFKAWDQYELELVTDEQANESVRGAL